jgi:site-specific DNA-methyltransferase (adenine-specific)/adenine-specific DNA-methyltransferase
MDVAIGDETFHKEPNILEQIAYRDTWGRGADSFISMIYERLVLMRDLMHPQGVVYVHCDWRVSAFVRLVLDEVFGRANFMAHIVWCYQTRQFPKTHWNRKHDDIIAFTKATDHKFNWDADGVLEPYSEATVKKYKLKDEIGYYRLSGRNLKGSPIRAAKDVDPKWEVSNPELVVREYLGRGFAPPDYWRIDIVNQSAAERVDYPTQKPEELTEKIIKASSNEGDLVADFFVGSGTTAAVAEKLGRKWICSDLGKFAVHTTRKRLIGVQRKLRAEDKPFRAFEVLNLGRYERQAYLDVSSRLPVRERESALAQKERDFRDLILRAYKAERLTGESFFHGKSGSRLVVVGPINLPVGRLFVEDVMVECRKVGSTQADILAFEFEMGLFPAVLDEARGKGLDLAPKTIPPEVFDKRAVEKGEVRFLDVSYIEATPRFSADGRSVAVELTDFSVYYSQGVANDLVANLMNGKSEVICDQGQLVKVSKDRDGVVTKDVLTKEWTDWVDYWAVDFNHENRKEIVRFAKRLGEEAQIPGVVVDAGEFLDYEERWTGSYIFENEWQSFRTRKNRELELVTSQHTYEEPGRYIIAVKVIDIFGNDTMTLVPITVS